MIELNTKEEGLKIISAELENFQSLEHKLVEIQGKSIVIVGKNGGSKSALLRAIQSPLNTKIIPQKAIKEGEESSYVKLNLKGIVPGDSEEKEFIYRIDFSEKNQKGKITVVDGKGKEIKTRGIQKDIIGDVSFDVDQFIRLAMTNSGGKSVEGVRKQVEILRQFLTKEEKLKLNELDKEYKETFEKRTEDNREVKRFDAKLKDFSKYSEKDIETYSVDKSKEVTEVQTKLGTIGEQVVKYNKATDAKASLEKFIKEAEVDLKFSSAIMDFYEAVKSISQDEEPSSSLTRLVEDAKTEGLKLVDLKAHVATNKEKLTKFNDWLSKNKEPKTEELQEELIKLNYHQDNFKVVDEFNKMYKEKLALEKVTENSSKRLQEIQTEKAKVFTDSTMPVKDLTFDEDGVYYKGLPFDGDHHPSSHILTIGVRLAMAMSPNLRCIFIKDGSLFDKKTFAGVLKYIEKHGYQLFIEMVDWNANDAVSVEFAEEFVG